MAPVDNYKLLEVRPTRPDAIAKSIKSCDAKSIVAPHIRILFRNLTYHTAEGLNFCIHSYAVNLANIRQSQMANFNNPFDIREYRQELEAVVDADRCAQIMHCCAGPAALYNISFDLIF